MKNIKVEINFNISEADFKADEMQWVIKYIRSGKAEKDYQKDMPQAVDLSVTIKVS